MNIEQEIWNDFKSLSESGFADRLSNSSAAAHYGVTYDDRTSLIHRGLNKRLEFDEDYRINKFLLESDNKEIDWEQLASLYPTRPPVIIISPNKTYPPAKFRTHKERREITNIILTKWENSKSKLYSRIPNETSAKEYLINLRWDGELPVCPRCESRKMYFLNSKHQTYRCAKCRYNFSEKTGTIFQNSPLPLLKWYESMYLLTSLKTRKISSHQLASVISVTQKTAWGIANKVQSKISDEFITKIRHGLFGDAK